MTIPEKGSNQEEHVFLSRHDQTSESLSATIFRWGHLHAYRFLSISHLMRLFSHFINIMCSYPMIRNLMNTPRFLPHTPISRVHLNLTVWFISESSCKGITSDQYNRLIFPLLFLRHVSWPNDTSVVSFFFTVTPRTSVNTCWQKTQPSFSTFRAGNKKFDWHWSGRPRWTPCDNLPLRPPCRMLGGENWSNYTKISDLQRTRDWVLPSHICWKIHCGN